MNFQAKPFIYLFICFSLFSCNHNTADITIVESSEIEYMNETLKTIHSRKSVRQFSEHQIRDTLLTELIKAGMAAPSARNLQAWAFIIIDDKNILEYLGDKLSNASMLSNASAAIIVCGDISKASTDPDPNYWVQDCCAATQNILLAAESLGLGAVWTAVYPYQNRLQIVVDKLLIPEHLIPLNLIPIGYPKNDDLPKNKWNPEVIFRNKFE